MLTYWVACALTVVVLLAGGTAWPADTARVFDRYKDRVVQVRLLESTSGVRASYGSGFIATRDGHVITNYHVLAAFVTKPDRYRVEVVVNGGRTLPAEVVSFDVVQDLAVLRADLLSRGFLELHTGPLDGGTRMFSLGSPLDLSLSIVEGTYNGLQADSLYERIHFSGAINSGMSGGPAMLGDGRVVGVNVASAGNDVGLLVPAKYAKALLTGALPPKTPPDDLKRRLRDQLVSHQTAYIERLMAEPWPTQVLHRYEVPGRVAPFVKCWADTERREEHWFDVVSQRCATDHGVYISRTHRSGTISYSHLFVAGRGLNRFQFFSLYRDRFAEGHDSPPADREDVTRFRCTTELLDGRAGRLKILLCLRGYRQLPGLYDARLRVATLNAVDAGLQSSVTVAGVSYENVPRLVRKYLDHITWMK